MNDKNPRTAALRALGQSLWLDTITRELLDSGALQRYIDDFGLTGLTSNPTIFDLALKDSADYDADIHARLPLGLRGEALFFELALLDLCRAADLFRAVHQRTNGVDGWVSLEVSPLIANDAQASLAAAIELHARAERPNLFIKIPGTPEGIEAIEHAIFEGVPINVTLLFSADQYRAASQTWLRGIERRLDAGRAPHVASVASLFISRWDVAVAGKVPDDLHMRLGIAVGRQVHGAYQEFLASARVRRVMNEGVTPQRLLFASTGTKDPSASDTLYVEAFAAPFTVNTLPEATLKAFADHGRIDAGALAAVDDGKAVLAAVGAAGIGLDALALKLQRDGAAAFVKSWHGLLAGIEAKAAALHAGTAR